MTTRKGIEDGFITALGTPLDESGSLVVEGLIRQIEDQVAAGVSALLSMGTMGNEAFIRSREYSRVAQAAAETVAGRIPLLVGVMDCSIGRVLDRIESLRDVAIDGVVTTAPYYLKPVQSEILNFFRLIADSSPFPLYLYDLPPVTQTPIAATTVTSLMEHPNIRGIKSGVLPTCRIVEFATNRPADFEVMYSGLDTFDVAWAYGLRKNLDGMFACTPAITEAMYQALGLKDLETARARLDDILSLRDSFLEIGVFKGFTVAMNQLGYPGSFSPDYITAADARETDMVLSKMSQIGMT